MQSEKRQLSFNDKPFAQSLSALAYQLACFGSTKYPHHNLSSPCLCSSSCAVRRGWRIQRRTWRCQTLWVFLHLQRERPSILVRIFFLTTFVFVSVSTTMPQAARPLTVTSKQCSLRCSVLPVLPEGKQSLLASSCQIDPVVIPVQTVDVRSSGNLSRMDLTPARLHRRMNWDMLEALSISDVFKISQKSNPPLRRANCLALIYSIPILFQSSRSLSLSVRFR